MKGTSAQNMVMSRDLELRSCKHLKLEAEFGIGIQYVPGQHKGQQERRWNGQPAGGAGLQEEGLANMVIVKAKWRDVRWEWKDELKKPLEHTTTGAKEVVTKGNQS